MSVGPDGIDLRISKMGDDLISEPGNITVNFSETAARSRLGVKKALGRRPTTASKTQKSININMNEAGSFKLPVVTDFVNNGFRSKYETFAT